MQKQKRDGGYVFLLLLAMLGIVCVMLNKEWERVVNEASMNIQDVYAGVFEMGEHGYNRIFVNGDISVEDTKELMTEENLPLDESVPDADDILTYSVGTTDKAYFDDSLFIGDSRTVGIAEYGYLENADFFADVSLSVYKVLNKKLPVSGNNRINLETLLTENKYGKVYVMLGINELGYDFENTVKKYEELLELIRKMQPEAIIYICGNLHVTEKQSLSDEYFNNENINRFNSAIAQLADGENSFYIDVNSVFDDENGNLSEEYCSDEVHVMGRYYTDWCDWLMKQAIIKAQ